MDFLGLKEGKERGEERKGGGAGRNLFLVEELGHLSLLVEKPILPSKRRSFLFF